MAEESPRLEESEEEAADGEEAAQAPMKALREAAQALAKGLAKEEAAAAPVKKMASAKGSDEEEAAGADTPPATEQEKASPTASRPLLSTSPAASTPQAQSSTTPGVNVFANDGSFLELFRKKMEAGPSASKEEPKEEKRPEPEKRRPISFVGKRRGGAKLALKTGMVAKKPKSEEEEVMTQKGGAWAQYMAEVKKYKAHQCSDDDKTRPLVK